VVASSPNETKPKRKKEKFEEFLKKKMANGYFPFLFFELMYTSFIAKRPAKSPRVQLATNLGRKRCCWNKGPDKQRGNKLLDNLCAMLATV